MDCTNALKLDDEIWDFLSQMVDVLLDFELVQE